MSEALGVRHRIAARDALAARTRGLTAAAVTVSAVLSGVFAGIAAASAPGHKLHPGTTQRPPEARPAQAAASGRSSTVIPPLPPPPGPGNLRSGAPPPAAAPAPAPAPTQAPPVVVSGGS